MEIPMLLSGPLTFRAAGLANSVIDRAWHLERAGHSPTILVDVLQPSLSSEVEQLRSAGRLGAGTRVFGMYDQLAGLRRSQGGHQLGLRDVVDLHAYERRLDPNDENVSRYYLDGEYVAFERVERGGGKWLDLLRGGRRYSRVHVSADRNVWRLTGFDDQNQALRDEFFDVSGVTWLTVLYKDGRPDKYVYRDGHMEESVYGSESGLAARWLSDSHAGLLKDHVLISEWAFKKRSLDTLRESLGVKIVYTFHSSHLGAPHRFGAPTKPELVSTLACLSDMDAVVVLTNSQRLDLMRSGADGQNIHVIPHVMTSRPAPGIERDPNAVVALGRLSPEKGVLELVRGFGRVVEVCPDAHLDVYGRGPLAEALEAEIAKLGLGSAVRLMGFTDTPLDVYAKAAVGVFPSLYEGQSLSLMQCMAAGCAPVGYDFKYGMRDMVVHGRSGLICDVGNMDEVVASIVMLLKNDSLREEIAACAASVLDAGRDAKRFVSEWESIVSLLSARRQAEVRSW